MKMWRRLQGASWSGLLLVALLGGCTLKPAGSGEPEAVPESAANVVPPGWYRTALKLPETEVPFFLKVPAPSSKEGPVIANGAERIKPSYEWTDGRLVIPFTVYDTVLHIEPGPALKGKWERKGIYDSSFELGGEKVSGPEPSRRFPALEVSAPAAKVEGKWRIDLERQGLAIGTFEQSDAGAVTGSIESLAKHGDYGFLAGDVRGNKLRMSTFNGVHALRIDAEIEPKKGTMKGTLWVNGEAEAFEGEKSDDFSLPDPLAQVALKSERAPLSLDVLQQPGYRGKPVIVEIFGTWCPNCNDAVQTLVKLYERYHDDGLEVLSLAFEASGDIEYSMQRVERFKERYGIRWQVIVFGLADAEDEDPRLPIVGRIEGVPTTIFVNADGTIRAVYSGFSGPATEAHARVEARFEQLTKEILATIPKE